MLTIRVQEIAASLTYLDIADVAPTEVHSVREQLVAGSATVGDVIVVADKVCWRNLDTGNIGAWEHAAKVADEIRRIERLYSSQR